MPPLVFAAVPSIPPPTASLPPFTRSLSGSVLNSSSVGRMMALPEPKSSHTRHDYPLSDTDTSLNELELQRYK